MQAHESAAATSPPLTGPTPALKRWLTRVSCRVWGHHVDNHVFKRRPAHARTCRCGERYLRTDGSVTRVRHTLSCFFGHHTYQPLSHRDGHNEYVCIDCGHPLVFAEDTDPYVARPEFTKKVRYLCGLFGHRVHQVTRRHGFAEYTCGCGHSFLRPLAIEQDVIRHPLICVASGHYVRYVASRNGYAEYVCRTCGHPFCFADPAA